jgi:RHS repeat-associated protein
LADSICLSLADSKLLAEYQPVIAKYYYYTSDQINSTRIITDSTGAVVYSAMFDPYGGMQKQWVNTYSPSLKFSGKERETKSEMDYFGARYYDHLKYRFLSVDPVINKNEALSNPQLWNLYSYCRNNPVTYLDSNGTYEKDVHYNLTKYLAMQAGFSKTDAQIIASSDQSIDVNSKTSADPRYVFDRLIDNQKQKWHFASDERVAEVITKAFLTRDLSDLGSALHCFQDSLFAHKKYRGDAEHAIESILRNPDNPSNNVGMAMEMAQGTYDILNTFMGNNSKLLNVPFLLKVFSNKNGDSRANMLSK